MILEHYSERPFEIDPEYNYRSSELGMGIYSKPEGFWVSVKGVDDWPSWCISESYAEERLKYRNIISIRDNSNILRLNNSEELQEFTREYIRPDGEITITGETRRLSLGIDWNKVKNEYDGIIIPNYLWESRFDSIAAWYYGWDCASGCIWNLDILTITSCEESGIVFPIKCDYCGRAVETPDCTCNVVA